MENSSSPKQNAGLVDKANATDIEIVGPDGQVIPNEAPAQVVVPIAPMFLIRYLKASPVIGGVPKMTCAIGYLIDDANNATNDNVIIHGFYHYGEPAAPGQQPPITAAGYQQEIIKRDILDIHPLIPLQAVDPQEADGIRRQLGFVPRATTT